MEVALLTAGELTRPDTNLRRAPWPELIALYDGPIRKASSKTDLIAALSSTFKDSVRRFRELGEEGVLQPITPSTVRRAPGWPRWSPASPTSSTTAASSPSMSA